jgi:hypothetical protein
VDFRKQVTCYLQFAPAQFERREILAHITDGLRRDRGDGLIAEAHVEG